MRLKLFALFLLIDGYHSMSVALKVLHQFHLEPHSLHGYQQYLLNSSAPDSTSLKRKPGSEEVVARFLLDYDRIAGKVRNKAIIDVLMEPMASFIQVTFKVHLNSRTPFVIINNKKVCINECWADLRRLGDSISVNFDGDPSNVIYVNWRGPTHFTFTYDSCEQPLDNVQCRHRKSGNSTVCICNKGVDSCDFSSPPLLNEEECNIGDDTTMSSTRTTSQVTTLQTTTLQLTTSRTTTRQLTTSTTTTRRTMPIRTSASTPRTESTKDKISTTSPNAGSFNSAQFIILVYALICYIDILFTVRLFE